LFSNQLFKTKFLYTALGKNITIITTSHYRTVFPDIMHFSKRPGTNDTWMSPKSHQWHSFPRNC